MIAYENNILVGDFQPRQTYYLKKFKYEMQKKKKKKGKLSGLMLRRNVQKTRENSENS